MPPDRASLRLRIHQQENLDFFRKLPRAFSLLPFGAGKGPVGVMRIGDLMPRRALVVTTTGMIYKWMKELKTWGDPEWKIAALYGRWEKRVDEFRKPHHVAVTNFDGLRVMLERVGEEFARRYPVKVIDEIHRAKNFESDIARDLAYICHPNYADYVYGLTGSPVLESPVDLWPLCRIVYPSMFGPSQEAWLNRYFVKEAGEKADGTKTYPKWRCRPGAMEHLADKLHAISFRRERAEIDAEYPNQVFEKPYTFELTGDALRAYRSAEKRLSLKLKTGAISLVSIYPRLEKLCQLSRGWCYDVNGTAYKYEHRNALVALSEAIEDTKGFGRIVIWAERVPDMDMVGNLLSRMSKKFRLVFGGVNLRTRNTVIRKFNEGLIDVLVAHPLCIGEGLDLEANHSFRYSYRWSAQEYDQTIGRVCRMSSLADWVNYRDFVALGTIDAGIMASVRAKLDVGKLMVQDRRIPWLPEVANGAFSAHPS